MPSHRPDDKSANLRTSQAKAAKRLNVSPRSVSAAKAVRRDAIPDVVDAVEQGKVSVSAAAHFAKEVPPLDQARLIAEHGSPAKAVKAAKVGDQVLFDWEATNHGPAIVKFEVRKKK